MYCSHFFYDCIRLCVIFMRKGCYKCQIEVMSQCVEQMCIAKWHRIEVASRQNRRNMVESYGIGLSAAPYSTDFVFICIQYCLYVQLFGSNNLNSFKCWILYEKFSFHIFLFLISTKHKKKIF